MERSDLGIEDKLSHIYILPERVRLLPFRDNSSEAPEDGTGCYPKYLGRQNELASADSGGSALEHMAQADSAAGQAGR